MYSYARAILWAQWRTFLHFSPRGRTGSFLFTAAIAVIWYGIWVLGAVAVGAVMASPPPQAPLSQMIPAGLFLAFLYWQVIPILMATSGASLEVRKLMVYPIPLDQLFALEVLLRMSTGIEMLIVLSGASAGLWMNPNVPLWAPLSFVPFVLFNLFLSAGVRDLLIRIMGRKRIREVAVLLFVLLAAIPQVLLTTGAPSRMTRLIAGLPNLLLPWGATGRLAAGELSLAAVLLLSAWTLAAWWFGRWQFHRGLRFDEAAANATATAPSSRDSWIDPLYRWPAALFRDPFAALLEKELRTLARSPRFRLVFFMGFSFGLLIWLPLAFGRSSSPDSFASANFLTIVSVYALLLLGDALFWNNLGFDRSAAQIYFLMPQPFTTALMAKNAAAVVFVTIEIVAVSTVCAVLRMPVTLPRIVEAAAVTAVLTLYLLALGNLGSVHQPRPMSPQHAWRANAARSFQALLLIVYPILCLPVALAFLARYAFNSELAFYAVLAVGALIGGVFYAVSLESSANAAERRREEIVATLSAGEGPVAA